MGTADKYGRKEWVVDPIRLIVAFRSPQGRSVAERTAKILAASAG
jgi:hypothetical protein